jgi:uncharacterized protein YjbI with pentapeptide repeats
MIEPQRAPVRPRVLSPHSGEDLLLEDEIRRLLEARRSGLIRLHADPDSAAEAVRHVAGAFAGIPEVVCTVSSFPAVELCCETMHTLDVVFSLAPWRRDDWIEYLLARHPDRCASVMARLRQSDGHDLPGSPALWRVVLDRMAADEALAGPREALLRHVYALVDDPGRVPMVQAACLNAALLDAREPQTLADALAVAGRRSLTRLLVTHAPLRLLLAADRAAADLAARAECPYLTSRWPFALVHDVARLVAVLPEALGYLRELVAERRWAMAASLLHATDTGWVPDPERLPVLAGAYLARAAWPDASLVGLKAFGAELIDADLRRADLTDACLAKADLRRTCLQRARLGRADLVGADLRGADLSFVRAEDASFRGADLRGADLDGALLTLASLEGANLDAARLTDADLRAARLTGATLAGADLSGGNLTGATLAGVKLNEARWHGAVFVAAALTDCDLEGMDLPDADFTGAKLDNALLTGSSLPDARLDRASLRNAGLAEVSWERASLRDADLTGASFHLGTSRSGLVGSPIPCEGSKTGFYTDDFAEQDFKSPEEVRKANLCFADLRGAKLDLVDLYLVDLRGALLDPEQEEHARRCGAILEARV